MWNEKKDLRAEMRGKRKYFGRARGKEDTIKRRKKRKGKIVTRNGMKCGAVK